MAVSPELIADWQRRLELHQMDEVRSTSHCPAHCLRFDGSGRWPFVLMLDPCQGRCPWLVWRAPLVLADGVFLGFSVYRNADFISGQLLSSELQPSLNNFAA